MLIGGAAGLGKTALAEWALAEAAGRGATVLVGRCYDLSETPPYGPWRDLFARYAQESGLPAPLAALAQREGPAALASQEVLFRQVRDFLMTVARQRPLVLVLDDLHWADQVSLDLLRLVARDLAAAPLLLLATYRSDELTQRHPLAALLPRLVREGGAVRLDLRPLDEAALRALVAARYPLPAPDRARLAAYLVEYAAGNPRYAGELVRTVEEAGRLRPVAGGWVLGDLAGVQVPPLLRQVIADRVARREVAAPRLLADELGVAPAPETTALAERIRAGHLEPHPPAGAPTAPARHNLPAPLTSFVGRDRELAEVAALLATTRLVTLTGTGGCGKTRLALAAATALLDGYPDGVWLVALAALADPALIPQAVAGVLGVREAPGQPRLAALQAALADRQLLLVLDNCEQLLDACAHLAEALLSACPHLRILATSREALRIPGEVPWRVPSLPAPPPGPDLSPAQAVRYPAVQLFVDRAAATLPGFRVTAENAPAVARICQRLDGIPLALELAAARTRVLAVEQIAARLDDRFHLLTAGSRTAPPRQQTLRAAIDWSYEALPAPAQHLLRRLAVFARSWTLDAAEAVCAGAELAVADVLDLLTVLVDKSLVRVELQGDGARYRLLETIWHYARDRLAEAGEDAPLRARHLAWCLALAAQAEPEVWGASGQQRAWLDRLETEHDNLRAALEWGLSGAGGADDAARLAGQLWHFWRLRGYIAEGRTWLARVLQRPIASEAARAKALLGAAFLARDQGDLDAARALAEEGLGLFAALGDDWGCGMAQLTLGIQALNGGDPAHALALLEAGLARFRASGHQWGIGSALNQLASLAAQRGEDQRARALFEEALACHRAIGDQRGVIVILSSLGRLAWQRGELGRARALLAESRAMARQSGWTGSSELELAVLLARSDGDYRQAEALNRASLATLRAGGLRQFIPMRICVAGVLAVDRGAFARGVRLLGAGSALRRTLGKADEFVEGVDLDASLAAARAGLDAEAYAIAWDAGQAMTLEQAIDAVLREE